MPFEESTPGIQLIASFHDYEKTPENLEEIFAALCALSPDVIKIVGTAQSSIDGLRMLSFTKTCRAFSTYSFLHG